MPARLIIVKRTAQHFKETKRAISLDTWQEIVQRTLLSSFQSVASLARPSHRCTGAISWIVAKGKQNESELHLRCRTTFLLCTTDIVSMMY